MSGEVCVLSKYIIEDLRENSLDNLKSLAYLHIPYILDFLSKYQITLYCEVNLIRHSWTDMEIRFYSFIPSIHIYLIPLRIWLYDLPQAGGIRLKLRHL